MSALGFVLLAVAVSMANYAIYEIGDMLMKHSEYKHRMKRKALVASKNERLIN